MRGSKKQTFHQKRYTDGQQPHERCSTSLNIRGMQIKLQWSIISHWSKWPSSKNLRTINAGKCVEKREPSCTAGGNVNWYHHCGEQYGGSSKTKNRATIWPTSPTPGHIPGENHNSERYMHPNVHCRYLQQPGHRKNLNVHQQRAG